ncbi:MAG TPA: TetR/AcrR family transcriptional regulator [Gammaproteobacteria bacterium]|nr:TetR/AcrR family transcriptional regulator [Gammaproteobacteria bacterium]
MNEGALRERQAQQVRTAVLEAAIAHLESKPAEDVSMADIAQTAGISLRTLYRYFPDRASLLRATGEHLFGSLGVPVRIAGPEAIAASFLEAAGRLSARRGLARTLVRTTVGQAARSAMRAQRVQAIESALKPLTKGIDRVPARRAVAAITHLCSAASWVSIADESGLCDAEAQAAVAWAIDALIATLQNSRRDESLSSTHP